MTPPKPATTERRGSILRFARAFRRDLLSALPARFYRAWMAEFRNPLIHSFFCNDPKLVRLILQNRPEDFPKSDRLRQGLEPLLGNSVFVTNGAEWKAQRRIIDPAFDSGRLRETYAAIQAAGAAAVARMPEGQIDIEPECSHAAADAIFRAMFSLPIEHQIAGRVFRAFRDHQDSQPVVNLSALLALPRWLPRLHSRRTRRTAREIRGLIADLVAARMVAIRDDTAPDDLATRLMTMPDPETGHLFSQSEMIDQVAIFFLAGHETSAAVLSWALWLLAAHPEWQDRVAAEAAALTDDFSSARALPVTRAVFQETLRLYPPVPMLVREAARRDCFRDRPVSAGAQIVISPWHLHRHERLWDNPDGFDPGRWDRPQTRQSARDAFIPFSAGPRACPGAGFAMLEGVVMLAQITRSFRLLPGNQPPVPVARLTVRGRDGILIRLIRR